MTSSTQVNSVKHETDHEAFVRRVAATSAILLFGISARDPFMLFASAILLLGAGGAAAFVPAVASLRGELVDVLQPG